MEEVKRIDCGSIFWKGLYYLCLSSILIFCYIVCPILIGLKARGDMIEDELFYNAIAITITAYLTPCLYYCIRNCKTVRICNYEISFI